VGGEAGLSAAAARRRAEGLSAMDRGRFDLARQAFAEVLEIAPDNLATQALYEAATRALLSAQREAGERFAGHRATVLAAPPWAYTLRRALAGRTGAEPRLVPVSEEPSVGDAAAWLERHGLVLPEYEVPNPMRGEPGILPPSIPPTFGKFLLVQAIRDGEHNLLLYGPDYAGGRFVAVQRADTGEIAALFDFEAYAHAPGEAGTPGIGEQRVVWAALAHGALLVSHAHGAPGHGSGESGYITAIDVESGELLWRSAPRVASAADFVVAGEHVVTAHGAAGEPSWLYVLALSTGKTVARARLRGSPEYLFLKSGTLQVRCDEAEYVFELHQGGG
ncbi:MAG TPA: hypothetical protein VIK91_04480, partial [Nannocystis sp.]